MKSVFEEFILGFERMMIATRKEKLSLLVDNFSSHQVIIVGIQLRVIKLDFLPPNTIRRFQPMDVGIIQSFKAQNHK